MDAMKRQISEDVLLNGRYKTLSPLNHGSFGMVFMARDVRTDETVAVKCLTKSSASQFCPTGINIDDRSEELAIHSRIGRHPNIVNLVDSFETEHHVYLVLEYCPNGDLYEAIRLGKGPLETEHVRDFMLQLVKAVEFMHSKGIYHRDIKPENLFLTHSGSLKLGDFGLATMDSWSYEYACGSDRYMAPEQFDSNGYGYSPAAADIWAIGICMLNVLFSRNPFATPTLADPLYADYLKDRQSLFDVFPNMSQDTFNVLMHSLALDPKKRSLSALREALQTAVSFTTDDETLDDFCTEDRDVVAATRNREPLRTPSISSPQIDNGGSFPWAKALLATPQKPGRQLSVIHDNESFTEELFPESQSENKDWYVVDPDAASLSSALDSGLGMSFKSSNLQSEAVSNATSQPVPISSSVPVNFSRGAGAMSSVYSCLNDNFSKSWSDLYEEEEEEQHRSSFESGNDIERVSTAKPITEKPRSVTPAIDIKGEGRRSATPRSGLREMMSANSRSNSPEVTRRRAFSPLKALAASAPLDAPPSPQPGRSIMDKWAALGNRRRGSELGQAAPVPEPAKAAPVTPQKAPRTSFSFTPFSSSKKPKPQSRERTGSWRKGMHAPPVSSSYQHSNHSNGSGVWERKATGHHHFGNDSWVSSKDWRQPQHQQPLRQASPALSCAQQLLRANKGGDDPSDDIGDLEWVGGWNDFHL
ncbi:cAMP-dependent protein kinase catalytic subunit [Zalaria obscura]|uniref:cAMP-dependent protein kinase catalytic subunit n=1 Tax=Zalaria obscura TaxID=2024903 RepID=A0ACC3S6Q3_9PEZI